MRIFAMIQTALFEARTIVFQKPDGHLRGLCLRDGDDDVRERRPCVVQVVLRRPCRMIRVRVIKAEKLGADLRRPALGFAIVRRTHQKLSFRYFSAPSGNTVTIMPASIFFATSSIAATAAPDDIPASSPSSRASRRTMPYARSVLI